VSWHPEPIGDAVKRELGRFGPAGSMGEIVAAWPAAVGEGIARNAWPARVARDGTLHVAAGSSAWAFELTQLAPTILERLRAALDEAAPSAVRFAVGPLPERGAESVESSARAVPDVRPEHVAEGRRIAAAVGDPGLRDAVARAAAASLALAGRAGDDRGV
jgi:hypothetical protein